MPHVPMPRKQRLKGLAARWRRVPRQVRHQIIGMMRSKMTATRPCDASPNVDFASSLATSKNEVGEAYELALELITWTLEEDDPD